MRSDIEAYEKEYLKRLQMDLAEREARRAKEEEAQEAARNAQRAKLIKTLSAWDYVVLESIRREDLRTPIRIGTMRTIDGMERLFHCGLVRKLSRKMSFDERERFEAFLDSPEYKQHEKRLVRIMTPEDRSRIDDVIEEIGMEKKDELLEITEEGTQQLKKRRGEMRRLWSRLEGLYYKKGRAGFQKAISGSLTHLPFLVTMGLANGAIMAYMVSEASPDHLHGIHVGELLSLYAGPGHDVGVDIGGDNVPDGEADSNG